MSCAIYNEIEAYPVEWLGNLINAGLIADGLVDSRSIADVHPDDVRHVTQFHTFAGIGAWSYALRLAGWPDSVPVWTGSCPCQPFSAAGKGRGVDDERHLWPVWRGLIAECLPPVIFGEQVASPAGRAWLDAGLHPLAHGTAARVGRLRAYGNAIVPQAAAAFVTAFMQSVGAWQ